jgi:hypothetical protein
MGSERDAGDDADQYLDLVAEEAAGGSPSDVLAVEAHSLLSAISTALHSLEAMHATDSPAQMAELQGIVRRQLRFIDGRLRELAGGLQEGSLTESVREDPG